MPFLFDLDGTLVDSAKTLIRAIDKVLVDYNLERTNRKENLACAGHGLMHMFRTTCSARVHDKELVEKLANDMLLEYKNNPTAGIEPYPNIYEGLTYLKEHDEKIAVVTNKDAAPTMEILSTCFPNIKFDVVYTPDKGWEKKPSQMSIKDFKSRYPEGRLTYLGDTEIDAETASGVADRTLIALWGYRTREELLAKGIPESCLIEDFKQVLK